MKIQIFTDGTCDLSPEWLKQHPYITIIDTPVMVQDNEFRNVTPDGFMRIDQIVKQDPKVRVRTASPAPGVIAEQIKTYIESGKDVLYITLSYTGSRGTTNAIRLAGFSLDDEGISDHFDYVDSTCMGSGLGLLIMQVADYYEEHPEATIYDLKQYVYEYGGRVCHLFTWRELSYLERSGRVPGVVANIAHNRRLFGANTWMTDDDNGEMRHLQALNLTATAKEGLYMAAKMLQQSLRINVRVNEISKLGKMFGAYAAEHIADPHGRIIIAHGNCPEDAQQVYVQMKKYLPDAEYLIGDDWRCGAGIQAHGGPTSIHVNFMTSDKMYLETGITEFLRIYRDLKA